MSYLRELYFLVALSSDNFDCMILFFVYNEKQ